MRLSDLLGAKVVTEEGESLGHVHDLRGELTTRSLRVTGLVVGKVGVLERLGVGAPGSALRIRSKDLVAWKDVARADRRRVVVRKTASRV
jgi:sporulation protein YlmC with PRC-barrel domain